MKGYKDFERFAAERHNRMYDKYIAREMGRIVSRTSGFDKVAANIREKMMRGMSPNDIELDNQHEIGGILGRYGFPEDGAIYHGWVSHSSNELFAVLNGGTRYVYELDEDEDEDNVDFIEMLLSELNIMMLRKLIAEHPDIYVSNVGE